MLESTMFKLPASFQIRYNKVLELSALFSF